MYCLPVIKYIYFFASILISLNRVRSCNSYLGSVSGFFFVKFIYDFLMIRGVIVVLSALKMRNFTLIFPKFF